MAEKSLNAQPFLRWAGAKRSHLDTLVPYVPSRYGTYYEPFLGSGALFFKLQPRAAVLGDRIDVLVRAYRAVRDGPRSVKESIDGWPVDRDTYYAVRALVPRTRFERAAQFIYLNKTCWNGLYRVNMSGKFNVPFGKPKSTNIVTSQQLSLASVALRDACRLVSADFETTLDSAGKNDFIFLDPPYVTAHGNNGFVDYNERIFSWIDQIRLRTMVDELSRKGAHVLLTNADHVTIRDLYDGFRIETIHRHSTLAGRASARKPITELIITNGKQA